MNGFYERHPTNSYIIRVGKNCKEYGNPYSFCCNVEDKGHGIAYIYGINKLPTKEEIKCLKEIGRKMGFKRFYWEREKKEEKHKTQYFNL